MNDWYEEADAELVTAQLLEIIDGGYRTGDISQDTLDVLTKVHREFVKIITVISELENELVDAEEYANKDVQGIIQGAIDALEDLL